MRVKELLARILVIALVSVVLVGIIAARRITSRDVVNLHGEIASSGGWNPEVISVQAGTLLHLRLTSDDVVHGFAIGQSDQPGVDILPGKVTDLELTFDQPGKYTFYCTRWCGLNHWRMRGTIEVSGDAETASVESQPPLYQTLNIDIDAPHTAESLPTGKPGARQDISALPARYLIPDYYRAQAPDQVFRDLRDDPALSAFSDAQIWDMVASIWRKNASLEGMQEGKRLYADNCAACHGQGGAGDGVFADDVQSAFGQKMAGMDHMPEGPTNFTDPSSMLGASPALLQGKILRGGMGTGMPYWGPIFTNQQTWDLVAYLYSYQFDYSEVADQ